MLHNVTCIVGYCLLLMEYTFQKEWVLMISYAFLFLAFGKKITLVKFTAKGKYRYRVRLPVNWQEDHFKHKETILCLFLHLAQKKNRTY